MTPHSFNDFVVPLNQRMLTFVSVSCTTRKHEKRVNREDGYESRYAKVLSYFLYFFKKKLFYKEPVLITCNKITLNKTISPVTRKIVLFKVSSLSLLKGNLFGGGRYFTTESHTALKTINERELLIQSEILSFLLKPGKGLET